MINNYRLKFRFKKTWDWLWNLEERATIRSLKEELRSHRRILEDYRISLDSKGETIRVLNLFIQEKLKSTPNVTYVCKHCGFKGKKYRDFCPGCQKDDSGKRPIDYYNSQK